MPDISRHIRLFLLFGLGIACLGILGWRLSVITIQNHARYAVLAAAQADNLDETLVRGNIFIHDEQGNDFLVATNRHFPMLMVIPAQIASSQAESLAQHIVTIVGGDVETYLPILEENGSRRRILARRLEEGQADQLRALNEPGIEIGSEADRSYPAGFLAADTIGFFGHGPDGRKGQYGVEAALDDLLAGSEATGAAHDVRLTLDETIQSFAERLLASTVDRYQADGGLIIVQEPKTGAILALADNPTFDPNAYGSAPVAAFLNSATSAFEPGSSWKPFTMAMGLDLGVITPTSTFVDDGDVVVDGYTIKNFNEQHFGRVNMTTVLEKSINTGTMYVESLIDQDDFLRYVVDMGFGQTTGIHLPTESAGDIGNLYTGRRINFLTASFGQGITVTPLQMIAGYSAIANGGRLMRPILVDAVRDPSQGSWEGIEPEVVGTPFTQRTAQQLQNMLVSVVDNGFDKARIPRYDIAGKTGTAQIASPEGGYLEDQYNHTFAGFAPAYDAKFTILIKLERPQGVTYAADSLSPVFKEMAAFLLNYLNVPPTR